MSLKLKDKGATKKAKSGVSTTSTLNCNSWDDKTGITVFVVTMRDEGRGISASDLPFVFERFYRGEKARSSKIPGSGLGLHISKYIIEKHGGWIECDSVIGEGTTVSFSLPI